MRPPLDWRATLVTTNRKPTCRDCANWVECGNDEDPEEGECTLVDLDSLAPSWVMATQTACSEFWPADCTEKGKL
jgi:hypothetical protein